MKDAPPKMIEAKVIVGHGLDCYSIANYEKDQWSSPWSVISERVEYRDKLGRKRKRGSYRWHFVRCNCTHCPAMVMFREDNVIEMLPAGAP